MRCSVSMVVFFAPRDSKLVESVVGSACYVMQGV